MRRLSLGLLVVVLMGLAAAPAAAADRLDALATTLRDRPLAIDPELSWLLDSDERRRILKSLEGSPFPIFAAVLPLLETDESGGDSDRVATALHRRLRRPGLYVIIDQRGELSTLASGVPRRGAYSYGLREETPKNERGPSFTALRVERLVAKVAALPSGETTETREPRPLDPYVPTFGERPDREDAASFGDTALGAGFVFGVLGLLTGGWLRLIETRRRRREEEAARAEAARRLREEEKRKRLEERRGRQSEKRPWWRKLW